jgi:hypothetical protein
MIKGKDILSNKSTEKLDDLREICIKRNITYREKKYSQATCKRISHLIAALMRMIAMMTLTLKELNCLIR